jgi:hypothetical protein
MMMANIIACLEPNQTAQRWECLPPSVEEYIYAYEESDDDQDEGEE